MAEPSLPPAIVVALTGAIDYAGLFPPASETLAVAVDGFDTCRTSEDRWALGRFVVPASRLPELAALLGLRDAAGWRGARISATVAGTVELELVRDFNGTSHSGERVDAIEVKLTADEAFQDLADRLPAGVIGYVELPLDDRLAGRLDRLKAHRLRAKIRMGGVTPVLFPNPNHVAAFLRGVTQIGLPFKATAGLHHPLRGEYRLTYEPGGARGTMFGFVNLILATLVTLGGGPDRQIVEALEERDPGACRAEGAALVWRQRRFGADQLAELRSLFDGFGSCSFREPMDELGPAFAQ